MMVLIPLCALALFLLRVPRQEANAEAWNGRGMAPIDMQPHARTATAFFGMG